MKIRNKILIYFSSTVITLTIASSVIVYFLFSNYREEEFQQRQKEKIKYTIELIAEYRELSENLTAIMDKHTIHDFYDEKMLIYDKHKNLIYKSVDDLTIGNAEKLVHSLSPANRWIETKESKYDIIAVYLQKEDDHYYAISKAYDAYGYTKLAFLRNTLIGITAIISAIVLLITFHLSNLISKPITKLAEEVSRIDITRENITPIPVEFNSFELNYLTQKFNQLIQKANSAFSFQKHTVHLISHQLKTPISVLVSELERIFKEVNDNKVKSELKALLVKVKSLGTIIHALLEIAKIESNKPALNQKLRVDEILFDVIAELNIIYPEFNFDINYSPKEFNEEFLLIQGNSSLIRQAFQNILSNSIFYNNKNKAEIQFDGNDKGLLKIKISNPGSPLTPEEAGYLFQPFFRGKNSQNKTGFGLGLVLAKRIFDLHNARISYTSPGTDRNVFEVSFPLR